MASRIADVGRGARSDQAGLRGRDQDRDDELPLRKTKSDPAATLYDGEVYDGEYGDGNIAGIVLFAGKRKSGKTFLQWRELNLAKHRRIIFDTEDQYKAPKYDTSGWKIFHQPGELRAYLATQLRADVLKVIYKPLAGNKLWHFRTVTRIVIEYARRTKGVLYDIDEVDQFCNPNEPLGPELNEAVEYGRHRLLSMAVSTRRPHKVSRNLTAQCAEFRIFKTNEPRDKKYFEEFIGSAVKELPQLGQYEYLRWVDTGECEVRGGKV
jgi:DNA helicase HerA-like ATPase